MNLLRHVLSFGIITLACGVAVIAQTQSTGSGTLTLDQAISIAIEHHPSLRVAVANMRVASAGTSQALSAYFPNISANASANRTDGWFVFNPAFAPRKQSYNNYTTGIQATQTIFDFGKTINRVSATNQFEEASIADYQSARGNVITNVQISYYGVIQAIQIVLVSEEAIEHAGKSVLQRWHARSI
jgi:outer membrane protein